VFFQRPFRTSCAGQVIFDPLNDTLFKLRFSDHSSRRFTQVLLVRHELRVANRNPSSTDLEMQVFMVERDLNGISMADLAGAKAHAIRQAPNMHDDGDRVRYIRSVFVPQDGRCLCLFEARNADIIVPLNRDAGLTFDRVSPAVETAA
jgi:hypothetical protein